MSIKLTQAAADRVVQFVQADANALGLRLGLKKTGCSGWAYTVDVANGIGPDDTLFEDHGVKVIVDAKHLDIINGTEIDFARKGLGSQFVFRNPNVVGECGCGESFSVDRSA